MERKYRYIKDFEKELIEYIEQGHTLRETGEKYGFTYQEMRDFKTRYNKKTGIAIKHRGRPRKKLHTIQCICISHILKYLWNNEINNGGVKNMFFTPPLFDEDRKKIYIKKQYSVVL